MTDPHAGLVIRRLFLAGAAAIPLMLAAPMPARAQWAVFDAANFSQNVLTAARELQQIENEVTSLQNEAQMLINQARNLTSLPYSSLQQLMSTIQRTQQLLGQAQGVIYDVGNIQSEFQRFYPSGYSGSTSSAQLIADAQSRWQNTLSGFQDALKTQATVVGNLNTTQTQLSALVSSSQGATGALQAAQAGNQLLALQSQQLADVTALLAAQGRAQSLQGAQTAAGQEQAHEQLMRFLTPGAGYQPGNVNMFHN
jgi:P-type conjugative transfer protein TrbJ